MLIFLQSRSLLMGANNTTYCFITTKNIFIFFINRLILTFCCSITTDSIVDVLGQLSSHSQMYSQNSEISQQSPFQKLISKTILLRLNEIIKLPDVYITSNYCCPACININLLMLVMKIRVFDSFHYFSTIHRLPSVLPWLPQKTY